MTFFFKLFEKLFYSKQTNAHELCELWNHAFRLMQILLNLPQVPEVTTQHSQSLALIEDAQLTTESVLEAFALLNELVLLSEFDINERIFKEWMEERLHGPYRHAFCYLLNAFTGNFWKALSAVDMSLLGPADPIFCLRSNVVLLEHIHPVLRLVDVTPNLVSLASSAFEPKNIAGTIRSTYEKLRWPQLESMVALARECPVKGDASFGQSFYRDIYKQCLRGLELRIRYRRTLPGCGWPVTFQPLMEFYRDRADCFYFEGREAGRVHVALYHHLIRSLVYHFILTSEVEFFEQAKCIARAYISTLKRHQVEKGLNLDAVRLDLLEPEAVFEQMGLQFTE